MLPGLLYLLMTVHSVALKWNPVTLTISGKSIPVYYTVQRQTLGATNWIKVNPSPTPCTELLDINVEPKTTYLYRVQSFVLSGATSPFSQPVTAQVP